MKEHMADTLSKRFLNYLQYQRDFSPHTLKSYRADIEHFAAFLRSRASDAGIDEHAPADEGKHAEHQPPDFPAATPIVLRQYLAELRRANYRRTTIARRLASLRSFYKFLVRSKIVTTNPVSAIRAPKLERRLPHFLNPDEIQRLLTTPPANDVLGLRDRAILETLYSTGVRVSELVGLNMESVDYIGEVIHVRGKGRKERLVPIGSYALRAMHKYLDKRNLPRRGSSSGEPF
ncbi:MAG: site-specific integrase, partial [Phycisphaerae bacterium]|nr:site-specific integrase [Phycisphaerae bacterium]